MTLRGDMPRRIISMQASSPPKFSTTHVTATPCMRRSARKAYASLAASYIAKRNIIIIDLASY